MHRRAAAAILRGVLILIASLVALVCGALFVGQRSLIYFPVSITAEALALAVRTEFGSSAEILPGFAAIVVAPAGAEPVETAIVFHGNAGLNVDRAPLAQEFAARGRRVVLAEYPGYGPRSGAPTERALVDDAVALYLEVARRFPRERIVLVGESLGAGVAAQAAIAPGLVPAPHRLVLITPLVSIAHTAARVYPFLPARLLVRDRYDVSAALLKFTGPVTLLIAGNDEVLGPEPGRQLAAIAERRGPTDVVEVAAAGHNDWMAVATSREWDRLVAGP